MGQDKSTDEPVPNLALGDDPGDASPEVPLRLKKKWKKTSERGATRHQAPSVDAANMAGASTSSAPITPSGGAPVVRKTPRVEFSDRVSFEYDGPNPLIYAPNRRAELVSQIKCGPKPLPPVADLIFKDEYVDGARTKLLVSFSLRLLHPRLVYFSSLSILFLCLVGRWKHELRC